jgi:hypothetical protein
VRTPIKAENLQHMKSSEFLEQIRTFAPSKEDFIKSGIGNDFAEKLVREFEYDDLDQNLHSTDEIVNLVSNYNVTKFVIGMITFYREVEENSDFYFFANFEADKLAINKQTGQIVMVDNADTSFVMCLCAIDSEHFLSAISQAWRTLTNYMLAGKKTRKSEDESDEIDICTRLSGDEQCRQFFEILL